MHDPTGNVHKSILNPSFFTLLLFPCSLIHRRSHHCSKIDRSFKRWHHNSHFRRCLREARCPQSRLPFRHTIWVLRRPTNSHSWISKEDWRSQTNSVWRTHWVISQLPKRILRYKNTFNYALQLARTLLYSTFPTPSSTLISIYMKKYIKQVAYYEVRTCSGCTPLHFSLTLSFSNDSYMYKKSRARNLVHTLFYHRFLQYPSMWQTRRAPSASPTQPSLIALLKIRLGRAQDLCRRL